MSNAPSSPFSGLQDPHGSWKGSQQQEPVPPSVPSEAHPVSDTQAARYGTFVPPPLRVAEDSRGRTRFLKSVTPLAGFRGDVGYVSYISPNQGSPYSIELKDHCHQQWIVVLLTILLFLGISYQILIVQVPPTGEDCGSRFGTILGTSKRVTAYSNCRYGYKGEGMQNYLTVGLHRIYTGAKWGSLEYARRYWILKKFLVIPSVSSPEQLMNLTEVMSLSNYISNTTVPLVHFLNLEGPLSPEPYNYTPQGPPSGGSHVSQEATKTAQQNFTNTRDVFPVDFQLTDVKASQNQCASYQGNSSLPQLGDLLVYAKDRSTLARSHVAVIVGVKGPYLQPVLNNVSQPPQNEKDQQKLNVTDRDSGAVEGSADAPTKVNNSTTNIMTANGTENVNLRNSTNLENTYVYYKVFLAEQNWDNRPWTGLYKPQTGANRKYPSSTVFNYNMNSGTNGLPSQSTKDPDAAVGSKENDVRNTELERGLIKNDSPRSFSRILILREYHPSCALYLEDNLGHRILGWVRPAPLRHA